MCFEYYQWKQRQDEIARRELLEQQKRDQQEQERIERERIQLDREEWAIPDEPIRIREKIPS